MRCVFCEYKWKNRIEKPKSFPRCKNRFDYEEARAILARIGRQFGYDLVDISVDGYNKTLEEFTNG